MSHVLSRTPTATRMEGSWEGATPEKDTKDAQHAQILFQDKENVAHNNATPDAASRRRNSTQRALQPLAPPTPPPALSAVTSTMANNNANVGTPSTIVGRPLFGVACASPSTSSASTPSMHTPSTATGRGSSPDEAQHAASWLVFRSLATTGLAGTGNFDFYDASVFAEDSEIGSIDFTVPPPEPSSIVPEVRPRNPVGVNLLSSDSTAPMVE